MYFIKYPFLISSENSPLPEDMRGHYHYYIITFHTDNILFRDIQLSQIYTYVKLLVYIDISLWNTICEYINKDPEVRSDLAIVPSHLEAKAGSNSFPVSVLSTWPLQTKRSESWYVLNPHFHERSFCFPRMLWMTLFHIKSVMHTLKNYSFTLSSSLLKGWSKTKGSYIPPCTFLHNPKGWLPSHQGILCGLYILMMSSTQSILFWPSSVLHFPFHWIFIHIAILLIQEYLILGTILCNTLPRTLTVSLSFCGDSKCLFELFSLANTGDRKKDWVEAKHEVHTLRKIIMVRKSKFPSTGICITIR